MVRAASWKKVWSGKALLKHLLLGRGESHVQTSDASAFLFLLGGLRARRRQERINVKTQGRSGGPGVIETRGPHLRGQPYTSGKVWTMQGGGHDRMREGKTAPLRCPCAIEGETSTPGPGCPSPSPTSACSLEAETATLLSSLSLCFPYLQSGNNSSTHPPHPAMRRK